jgi:hypothetical protein
MFLTNYIGGVVVSMLASIVVDQAKIKILFVSPFPTDPGKFYWLAWKKKKLFQKFFRFHSGNDRKLFQKFFRFHSGNDRKLSRKFQFGIFLELRMTSSKVIEANPYRKAITTMDTTWCVGAVENRKGWKKTLISNAVKKIGCFSECYSCALTSAKYERI